MANGVITGTTNISGVSCKIEWESVADVTNNKSTVTVNYYVTNNSGSYIGMSGIWSLKWKYADNTNEQTISVSGTTNAPVGQTTKQWTRSFEVSHADDGTRGIKIQLTGGYESTRISSGILTLDTIARECKFVSISPLNVEFGTSATITIEKPNTTVGAICTIELGSRNSTVNFDGATTSATWTLPSAWVDQLATGQNSLTATATLRTYTDSNHTTRIGQDKTYSFNAVRQGTVPTESTLPWYFYKDDINGYENGVTGNITGGNLSTNIVIQYEDVVSYTISGSTESESIPLGATISNTFSLTYDKTNYSFNPRQTIGATVSMQAYSVISGNTPSILPFGRWFITEIEASDQSPLVTLSGVDAMSAQFDSAFVDSESNYPRTLYDIAYDIASSCGITIQTPYFRNYNVSYSAMPNWPEDVTKRDVLAYIATCAGGIARIAYDGCLQIASLRCAIPNHEVSLDRYTEFVSKDGNTFEFNAIKVVDEDNNESWYVYNDAIESSPTNTIQIQSNPLLTSGIMSSILTCYTTDYRSSHNDAKMTYVGGSFSFLGSLRIMCGDEIKLYRTDGTVIPTQIIATSCDITFDAGGLNSEISCDMPTIYTDGTSGYSSTQTQVFNADGTINAKAISGSVLDYRTGTVSGVGTSVQSVTFDREMKGLPFVMVTQNGGSPSAVKVTSTTTSGFKIQAAINGCSFKYMAIYFSGVDADAE